MTMTRRRLLDDTFKKTVEGNPAIATDSLARMYPGIAMQGWTEQAKTTGAQLLDESTIEQGLINGNTGNEGNSAKMCRSGFIPIKPNTQYYFSGQYSERALFYDSSQAFLTSRKVGSIVSPKKAAYMRLRWLNASGHLSPQDVIAGKPMLNEGTTALPYEPYTGGAPSPSPDYPQEIVSAGTWDETAQKWDYEITITNAQTDPDKNQTVTIQSDRQLTKWDRLEKRGGQWGWVYKSNRIEMDGSETGFNENYLPILILGMVPTGVSTDRGSSVKPRYDIWSNYTDILVWSNSSCNECSINLDNSGFSTIGVNSTDTFKRWLAQKHSEGNSFYYEYETSAETFVPLSESEQEAMNALYTYRPTTVLSNQQDCQMALTYKTRKSMEVTT